MTNFEFPRPDIQFRELTSEQQHSMLKARQIAARNIFEEVAQNPSADIDYQKAQENKSLADQTLTAFEIEHGFIKRPEE